MNGTANRPSAKKYRFAALRASGFNPREAGVYVIRAKFAPHTMSQPHWHPEARYVTVLKGIWWAGTGDKFDPDSTTPVPAGGGRDSHAG